MQARSIGEAVASPKKAEVLHPDTHHESTVREQYTRAQAMLIERGWIVSGGVYDPYLDMYIHPHHCDGSVTMNLFVYANPNAGFYVSEYEDAGPMYKYTWTD
jgi:hypothetical protein